MTVQFTTLFSFSGGFTGVGSDAGLFVDSNGNLFGTTEQGGVNNYGTVFEIQNIGTVTAPIYASSPTTLVSINANGLIADANGDLFGTSANGVVFEIKNIGTVASPIYTGLTTLASFDGSNGANPYAGLIADTNGDLFGTSKGGGANNDGTVFEIENTGTVAAPIYIDTPTALVSFNGSNGQSPDSALITDANGDLFGTTPSGGANNYGTVFEIQNIGTVAAPIYASAPTTLVSFDGLNGQDPKGGLIADANGNLFGTTGGGYVNGMFHDYGTVFEIQNTGTAAAPIYASAPTTVVSFGASIGEYPQGLIIDANGDLFGTTQYAGPSGVYGTVFKIQNTGTVAAPVYSSTPTTLVSFDGTNGAQPLAGLTADATGNLFGTTSGYYAWGGSVFEISGAGFTVTPPPTISGTIGGQATTMEAPVAPFKGVTIGDANVGATNTLTITLGGAGGTLSGTGLSGGVGGVYTLSGTAAVVTSELDALVFTPKAGAPHTTSTTTFTLSDLSSANGAPAVDSTTSVTDSDPAVAPTIAGTVSGQTTTSEASIKPFVYVTVGDRNVGATETLTITLGGARGTLTDGVGFSSLTSAGAGVYRVSGTASAITSELDALIFTPTAGAPHTTSTTTFALSDMSSANSAPAVDSTTSVIDIDPAVAPTISGTGSGLTTTSETPVKPFAHATVGDANVGATDTLTITLGGPGGTLSGTGLSGGSGVYSLSGTAAAITSELDALVFTPKAGAPHTTSTTTFTLSDLSSANGAPAVDSTTSVTDSVPAFVNDPDKDIMLQRTDGQLALWQVNGTTLSASELLGPNPGSSWLEEGTGAFFGSDASDILLQNTNGTVAAWEVQNNSYVSSSVVADPGSSWHVEGTGDFNGDDHTDVLLQNDNGKVAVWEMNGSHISQSGVVANPGTSWHVEGTGDFNHDGKSDIVLQNNDGRVAIWDMSGDQISQSGVVNANPGPSWHIKGTGDFYSDGYTDILWQNDSGRVAIWRMNGDQISTSSVVADPGPSWHVVGTGDFNLDGKTDIVLQNNNGAVAVWDMNGSHIGQSAVLANPGPTWSVEGTGHHGLHS